MQSAVPAALRDRLRGYRWRKVTIGESGADVFHLTRHGQPALYLKHLQDCEHLSLADEAARLRWLEGRAPAPGVIDVVADGGREWLLMTALPGTNAASAAMSPSVVVRLMAEALRDLHTLPVSDCPFDETLERKVARARESVARGLVEEEHFDDANLGRSAGDLLAEMLERLPGSEDLVVTHGDACLPNFMLQPGRFAGFIDCNRLGRADRYQDLALACRSIEYNLGESYVGAFLAAYGASPADRDRLDFYRLLDEFA